MNKRYRDLTRELGSCGYDFDHVNSKGREFWTHPDTGAQVFIPTGLDERCARNTLDTARRLVGLPTKDNKRNPQQIRERNAAEHEKAARELAALAAAREHNAAGASESRMREIEDAYLAAERKFRYWQRLMQEAA